MLDVVSNYSEILLQSVSLGKSGYFRSCNSGLFRFRKWYDDKWHKNNFFSFVFQLCRITNQPQTPLNGYHRIIFSPFLLDFYDFFIGCSRFFKDCIIFSMRFLNFKNNCRFLDFSAIGYLQFRFWWFFSDRFHSISTIRLLV